ncbi:MULTISPECIES: helix-turn-helix domain-containing protein [Staphylococcus]|uniref:helix-turn-helix domain-containing protein n=1 Tax=Staphylococcus TaxID=1279 RepID=UPI0008A3EFD8|nr:MULTISPECIES: helix-turn-helix transcriptional regulator [Staphylococcus]MCI2907937.1 helix-turn-helix domain-containing protein [Staphylococcus hominis]OFS42498.1 hypothetical protein HMPREF2881_04500 [Staphylococcus sp. HMSC057A08]
MKFGEVLNKYRESLNLSVNKLGELADVSPTYISRLQNNLNKKPSKKVFFKILNTLLDQAFNMGKSPKPLLSELCSTYLFDDKKEFTKKELKKVENLVEEFIKYTNEEGNKVKKELYESKSKIENNKIIFNKKNELLFLNDFEILKNNLVDKPIFDIEWYFTQNQFKILAPRYLITNKDYNLIDYNVISNEDKNIILNLIIAYLETKYEKINNRQEFFDTMFELFVEKVNLEETFDKL